MRKKYDRKLIIKALQDAGLPEGLSARASQFRATPETFDNEKKTVRFVATTEQPATVFDWDRYDFVDEVLLADGMIMPRNGQVPLLDSHARFSIKDVIGSARDFAICAIAGFKAVDCEVSFAGTADGQEAAQKVEESHVTDCSVGYRVHESYWIPEGEKQLVAGREFTGPLKVSTKWEIKELSLAPIGADNLAKARAATAQPQKEESDMNKTLRAFLERHGLPKEATDAEALTYLETMDAKERAQAAALADTASDKELQARLDKIRKEATDSARAEERQRITDINERCRLAGMDEDFARTHIDGGSSVEQVSSAIFEQMKTSNPPVGAGAHNGRAQVGVESGEKFRAAAVDGLLMRTGTRIEKPAPGAADFRGRSLLDVARESLELAGVDTRSLGKRELARRALSPHSSSDFPLLMAAVANKHLLQAYNEWPATWRPFVAVTGATDFKTQNALRLSGAPDLEDLGENGEYKTADFDEASETYRVITKGRIIRLTRVMLINDDLRAFARIPRMFAVSARRMEAKAVYGLITANGTMSDGVALFHATHKNLEATGGAPSSTTLGAARAAMRKQVGLNGETIDVQPAFLLTPTVMETTAEILLRSTALPDDNKSGGVFNPWAGKLSPISDPLLDADSTVKWYLVAHPDQVPTIEVAYLEGEEQPYVEEELDFDSDSLKIKARHDFGAGVVDHVGIYQNDGA